MKNLLFILVTACTIITAKAQIVNIPDANFKATLLAASHWNYVAKDLSGTNFRIDANGDGEIQVSEAEKVIELYILDAHLTSLQGIEAFVNLTSLDCRYNQLTTLDVSKNTVLTYLTCDNNQLTSLNVSGATALYILYCGWNQLTTLDVSKNTALGALYCNNNQLTSLDVSGATALGTLGCDWNQLTTLDVSGATALSELSCYNNQLITLDVSKNTALDTLGCGWNQLTTLDVSKNMALGTLYCNDNPLFTSLYIKNGKSTSSYFDGCLKLQYICCNDFDINTIQQQVTSNGYTNCVVTSACSLGTNELNNNKLPIKIFPNPAKDKVQFSEKVKSVQIFDLAGRLVQSSVLNATELNITSLKSGDYLLKITTDKGSKIEKLVKK